MPDGTNVGANTLDPEKQSTPVNQPASGTYGERADLDRLKASLPSTGQQGTGASGPGGAPAPGGATPVEAPVPGAPSGVTPPPGMPPELLTPTDRPGVPITTPLAQPPQNPVASAVGAQQQRLAMIDVLAEHPDSSPETREWAALMRNQLIGVR